jgi:hypothetical protein
MELSRQLQPLGVLIETDRENIAYCKQSLLQFDSRMYSVFEDLAIAYEEFGALLGSDKGLSAQASDEIQEILNAAGISGAEFVRIMETEENLPHRAAWKRALDRLAAIELRTLLVLACPVTLCGRLPIY